MKATLGWAVTAAAAAVLAASLPICRAQASDTTAAVKDDVRSAGHALAHGATTVGHSIAEKSRTTGHAIAADTRSARDTVREDSRKTGHSIAEAARNLGKTVRDGFHSLKAGGSTKRTESEPKG